MMPGCNAFDRLRQLRPPPGQRSVLLLLSTILPAVIQGIMPRSFSPTSSIWWASFQRRIALKLGWPTLHSAIQSRTKRPFWMSSRTAFIRALVSS
jgi:hypothetical protein